MLLGVGMECLIMGLFFLKYRIGEGARELGGDHSAVQVGLRSSLAKRNWPRLLWLTGDELCQGLPAIYWQIPWDGQSLGEHCKRKAAVVR